VLGGQANARPKSADSSVEMIRHLKVARDTAVKQAPQSLAKAASERMRSGLSPTRMSISAAVPVEIPWASSMAGAQDAVKASRSASWALISASSVSQRRASARKAALAEAVVEAERQAA
jgi:hypothetical protein